MPVRDLTDRPRQMPRLGKIRLGDQSGTNGSPKNLPHFVVPDEVAAVYGPNPTELPIVFLSDDEEVIASSYYRAYNASNGLVCKGDGFVANAMLDAAVLHRNGGVVSQPLDINLWAHGATRGVEVPATKDVVKQEIDCWGAGYGDLPPCPMFALKKCAVRTFFQFAIYGVPGLGVYQMDTGSVINVGRLLGTLAMARTVLGGISGVPMILSREKTDVAPTGTKHGVYTVNLRIDTKFSLTEVLKLRAGPVANALLPPVDESEVYEGVDDEPLALTTPGVNAQQAAWEQESVVQEARKQRDEAVRQAVSQHEAQQAGVTHDASESPPSQDEPAATSVDTAIASIHHMLVDCKQTWGAKEYGELFRELSIFMPDGEAKFDPKALDGERATACLTYLRERRGEAVPA